MQKFIIGTDNFGVGEITYDIDKTNFIIKELTIIGNQQTYEELSEDEEGEWNWTLYPPKIHLRQVPFELNSGKIHLLITEEMLDEYDITLYLMEHNDIYGNLTIDENDKLLFEGITYISGDEMKLELEINLLT